VEAIQLSLEPDRVTKEMLEDLQDIVFRYPGECRLLFRVGVSPKKKMVIAAHDRFRVLPCPEIIAELEALTGKEVDQLIAGQGHHS
jgi:DNA polymerase-3 subunit alpha